MKKLSIILILTSFIVKAHAQIDGSQWIYAGYSPSSSGMAYTGTASVGYAGDVFFNPAAPAFTKRFRLFGQYGVDNGYSPANIGVSYPISIGVLTAAFRKLNMGVSTGVNSSIMSFHLGFSKMITSRFSFGFSLYGLNQFGVIDFVTNSGLGVGLDIGAIFKLIDKNPYKRGLVFKNMNFGAALLGLGKQTALPGLGAPMPGIGLRLGFSADFLDMEALIARTQADLTLQINPLNYFGNLGVKFTFADLFSVMGGVIIGNNGIGGLSNGLIFFTLGASLFYQFGETPVEIFYSYNPHNFTTYNSTHFFGAEVAFGVLDTTPPEASIHFDGDKIRASFSPNYDGSKDIVEVFLNIDDKSDIKEWKIEIFNNNGHLVKIISGVEKGEIALTLKIFWERLWEKNISINIPEKAIWDGFTDSGSSAGEGRYTIVLEAIDEFGNAGISSEIEVVIDTTQPSASIGIDRPLFSPNNDGYKDTITIYQELSEGDNWKAQIRDIDGNTVEQWDWEYEPPEIFVWDGIDENGNVLPDGTYDYILYGEDEAGNKMILPIRNLNLSTEEYSVFLSIQNSGLSPNDDGINDIVKITPKLTDTQALISWSVTIRDRAGAIVRNIHSTNEPSAFYWEGLNDNGDRISDGEYLCRITAEYINGDIPSSHDYLIRLDTSPPAVELKIEPALFSPDGGVQNDTLNFYLTAIDAQGIKEWKLDLYNTDGILVKSFEGAGEPAPKIQWNGVLDSGELLESGRVYMVKITIEDNFGNKLENMDIGVIKTDTLIE